MGLDLELPFQVTWFTDRKAKRQLERIVADTQPDLIYCQLVRCAEYVKDLHAYPKVLDYMDAFSAGMHRRSHQERGLLGLFRHAVMRARARVWPGMNRGRSTISTPTPSSPKTTGC